MDERTLDSSRRWVDEGTALLLESVRRMDDESISEPTALPGWTGRHLLAHLAANADALLNLVRWASTGRETPMYSSPDQRNADIEKGADQPPAELRREISQSAGRLTAGMDALSGQQWSREVRTAQGRLVPATEIPWLRAREVMVHTVDLDRERTFDDLPPDFLVALVDDVVAKRSPSDDAAINFNCSDGRSWTIEGPGSPIQLSGSLASIAVYVTGREGSDVTTSDGHAVPNLQAWL
jgi:maleylpyruvate isomerase